MSKKNKTKAQKPKNNVNFRSGYAKTYREYQKTKNKAIIYQSPNTKTQYNKKPLSEKTVSFLKAKEKRKKKTKK